MFYYRDALKVLGHNCAMRMQHHHHYMNEQWTESLPTHMPTAIHQSISKQNYTASYVTSKSETQVK